MSDLEMDTDKLINTAIRMLRRKYEEGKSLSYVMKPLAWALHKVWIEYDRIEPRRELDKR